MLIRNSEWEKIRMQFTDAEKIALREAYCGSSICPPGAIVDRNRMSPELFKKLNQAINEVRK